MLAVDGTADQPEPLYYLVLCARTEADLDGTPAGLSLVADADRSVYKEWSRTYAENRRLHERIRELREKLQQRPAPAAPPLPAAPPRSWLARLLGRWLG